MVPPNEMPCWEITKCEKTADCPATKDSDSQCWEIAAKLNDYRSNLNVCEDCIVYLAKQKDSDLPQEEIKSILEKKGVCVLVSKCPQFTSSDEEAEK